MRRFSSLALLVAVAVLGTSVAATADESSKTPQQILADVQRDLAKVRSYHFSGSEVDRGRTSRLAGDVSAAGRADLRLRDGATSARVIVLPPAMYIKANAAWWKANGGSDGKKLADKLADHWFKVNDPSLRSLIGELLPKRLASCIAVGTGTLKKGGVGSVAGKRAVVIVDAGDKPATTPGRLYVAATGRILPLRLVQTGKRRPGGHVDQRCDDPDDTSTASDLRLSRFDEPLHIRAPHGAVTVPDDDNGAEPA
jgi:hypothetical protein